jgi:hypothetical protein
MATASITITDTAKGVDIKIESDPPFPGPAAEDQTLTNAQGAVIHLLGVLQGLSEPQEG